MKQPNDLARQVMAKAADNHAKLADLYEQIADEARKYAIALRNVDIEALVTSNDELLQKISEAKKAALSQLNLLQTADPEFLEFLASEARRRFIMKMSKEQLVMELLIHTASCKNPHKCEIHQLMEKRASQLGY